MKKRIDKFLDWCYYIFVNKLFGFFYYRVFHGKNWGFAISRKYRSKLKALTKLPEKDVYTRIAEQRARTQNNQP